MPNVYLKALFRCLGTTTIYGWDRGDEGIEKPTANQALSANRGLSGDEHGERLGHGHSKVEGIFQGDANKSGLQEREKAPLLFRSDDSSQDGATEQNGGPKFKQAK